MPRNYKRKAPERCVVTEDQLNTAKLLISKGLSKRCAASQIGLKESTLRNRLKIGKTAEKMGFGTTFSKEQEQDIFNYLKECENLLYGLTMNNLKKLIFEYAEIKKIRHRFNTSTKVAGKDWVYGFLKRFPELNLHIKTPPSAARAAEINKTHITLFHENLKCLYNKYNFAPSRIYNLGERDIVIESKESSNIISMKASNQAGKVTSAEKGQIITLVCTMSASGNFFPPAFIFPQIMKMNLLKNVPKGCIGMVSDNGFKNRDLFLEYLHHFKEHVQATKDNPALLILDFNTNHIFLEAVNFCRDNGICLITLPPYTGCEMQPLTQGIFCQLETNLLSECEKWLNNYPGVEIGESVVTNLVNEAFTMVATKNKATTGFNVTGIWPVDCDISSEIGPSIKVELIESLEDNNLMTGVITVPDVPSTSKDTDPLSST